MNLYSGCTLAQMMRPIFWQRVSNACYKRNMFLCKSLTLLSSFISNFDYLAVSCSDGFTC